MTNDEFNYLEIKKIINNYENNDPMVTINAFVKLSQMDIKYFEEFEGHPFLNYRSKKNQSLLFFLLNGETNIDFCQKIFDKTKRNIKFNVSYSGDLLDNKYFERNYEFLVKNNLLQLKENQINKDLILVLIKRNSFKFYNKLIENNCYLNLWESMTSNDKKYFNIILNNKNTNCKIYDYIKNCNNDTKFNFYIKFMENPVFFEKIDLFSLLENDLLKYSSKEKNFNIIYFGNLKNSIKYKGAMNIKAFKEYFYNNIMSKYSDDDMKIINKLFDFKNEELNSLIEKRNITKSLNEDIVILDKISNKNISNKRRM